MYTLVTQTVIIERWFHFPTPPT